MFRSSVPTVSGPSRGRSATHGRAMTVIVPLIAVGLIAACGESTVAGPASPSAAPERGVYTVPTAIVADCSVDVTGALQKWFATVPDSSTLVFGKNACYNIDGGLVVADRRNLTFEGNGSTFQVFSRGNHDRANWTIKAGSNLTWRNMIARGANPHAGLATDAYDATVEGQHAFRFEGTQTALLDSVQAYDVWGDFVEAEPDWRAAAFPGEPTRNVTVRNSRFERNGRMGIGLTHVDGFLLQNSYLGDVRWSAIDLELDDSREVGKNIRIEQNHFGVISHSIFVAKGAGLSQSIENIGIRDNVMDAALPTCLEPISMRTPAADRYWAGWVITGNTLRVRNQGVGIHLTRADSATVSNNTIISGSIGGCAQSAAMLFEDSHSGVVDSNTAMGGYSGAYAADSLTTGFTFTANVVR